MMEQVEMDFQTVTRRPDTAELLAASERLTEESVAGTAVKLQNTTDDYSRIL